MNYINMIESEAEKHGWGLILIKQNELKSFLDTLIKRFGKIKLLEIGAWKCLLHDWLKKNNYDVEYVGIDVIEPKGRLPHARFMVMSPTYLLFEANQFHAIVMIETLEHIFDYVQALRECYRVLVPNGGIFIESVSCSEKEAIMDETHVHVLHPKTLARLLRYLGFRNIHYVLDEVFALWAFK